MGKIFVTQGQVTPKLMVRNQFIQDFMTVFVTRKFDKDPIKNENSDFRGKLCSPNHIFIIGTNL